MAVVYISIGSNMGDRQAYLQQGIDAVARSIGDVVGISGCSKLTNNLLNEIDKKGNRSLVWARIFDTYGPYENEKKFCSYVIKNCINQKKITCNNPQLGMDFLHVQDIANAFKFTFRCIT